VALPFPHLLGTTPNGAADIAKVLYQTRIATAPRASASDGEVLSWPVQPIGIWCETLVVLRDASVDPGKLY